MKKIILDCSEGMSIFVDRDGKIFSFVDKEQKRHTDNLLFKLDELLNETGINVSEIDVFCVCIGPGSFTGIRVAVSIVKGLAINSNAKICVASNFDIVFNRDIKNCYYVLEGFSNCVYVRKVCNEKIEDSCIDIEDLILDIKKNKIVNIYAQNSKVQNLLKNAEICAELAENQTLLCFDEKIKNNEFVNLNEINPIYLRASQAEIERMKKLGNNK